MKEDSFISVLLEKLHQLKRDREVREVLCDALQNFSTHINIKPWGKQITTSRKISNDQTQVTLTSTQQVYQNTRGIKERTEIYPTVMVKAEQRKRVCSDRRCVAPHPRAAFNAQRLSAYRTNQKPAAIHQKTAEVTVVGYCFSGNPVPYRTKVRGKNITLGHFKTLLNRKGHYRYFFKKYCNEFGTDTVFEEVTDDEELVPLWEGKIFAMVEEMEEVRI